MANLLIIGIVGAIVIVLFFIIRFRHMRHRFYVIFIVLMLAFFYFSGVNIIKQNNTDLTSFNGLVTAGKVYIQWLGKVVDNVKTLSGNVVRADWGG